MAGINAEFEAVRAFWTAKVSMWVLVVIGQCCLPKNSNKRVGCWCGGG
jgi:hypothetical protein